MQNELQYCSSKIVYNHRSAQYPDAK